MKMTLKVFALACLLFAAFANQAQAQRHGRGEAKSPSERAGRQTERMTKHLGLSEKQAAKVGEINLKYAEQMKAERDAGKEDREAKRAKMKETRTVQDAELKSVLTTEQYDKMLADRAEKMEKRKEKMEGRKGKGGRKGSEKIENKPGQEDEKQ